MLTNTEQHHLAILARGNGSPVYDATFLDPILRSLVYKRLAKRNQHGMHSITLRGLIEHRKHQGDQQ